MNASAPWSRVDTWCALVLAAVTVAASAMAITTQPVGVFQDDGMYVVLARSLAEGEGYRFSNLPNAPHGTHFPPLYPLWLALLWKMSPSFPANVQLFKLGNSLLLGAAAVGAFMLARRQLGFRTWPAAGLSLVSAACAPLIWLSAMVLSEPAFLAALFPVLLLAERAARASGSRTAVAAGAAAGALALLRSLGMFIVPALAVVLVLKRRWWAAAAALLAGILVVAPWQIFTMLHADELPPALAGKYGSYFGWVVDGMRAGGFAFVTSVVKTNASHTVNFLSGSLGIAAAHWALRAVAVALLLVLFVVGARRLRDRAPVTAVFTAIYVLTVLLWPFPPHRFYWGIMPILVFTAALGAREIYRALASRRPLYKHVLLAGATVLALMYARPNLLGTPRWEVADEERTVAERSRAVAQWVARNAGPKDLIATEDDVLIHLYTGRPAIPLFAFTPHEYVKPQTTAYARATLDTLLRTYPVRWVLPVNVMGIHTSLALAQRDSSLVLREGLSLGAVFERVRDADDLEGPRP